LALLDIHLSNELVKLPSSFDHLSIAQFHHEYGEPGVVPVTHRDGMPLPPNVPKKAVIPFDLGKPAKQFSLFDSCVLLNDLARHFLQTQKFAAEKAVIHH
jgi:serine/threonine-protein kinase SRPK3